MLPLPAAPPMALKYTEYSAVSGLLLDEESALPETPPNRMRSSPPSAKASAIVARRRRSNAPVRSAATPSPKCIDVAAAFLFARSLKNFRCWLAAEVEVELLLELDDDSPSREAGGRIAALVPAMTVKAKVAASETWKRRRTSSSAPPIRSTKMTATTSAARTNPDCRLPEPSILFPLLQRPLRCLVGEHALCCGAVSRGGAVSRDRAASVTNTRNTRFGTLRPNDQRPATG